VRSALSPCESAGGRGDELRRLATADRTLLVERDHWQRRIEQLDPDVDFAEIYRIMAAHEFPWDMTQSLGRALYRT
jgi:hypothetical protein